MRVIDVRGRQERMQQRLDQRPRWSGAKAQRTRYADHLRVVHRVSLLEPELVQPKSGEAVRCDRREIRPEPLTQSVRHLAAGVVDGDSFRGGIPSAAIRERSVGAERLER